MDKETELWLEINDPEITATQLQTMIEQRVRMRQTETDFTAVHFPDFGASTPMPVPAYDSFAPDLFSHLHILNQLQPPESLPVLTVSPATRLPILGGLWQMLRHYAHDLVCFYVNRLADHSTKTHHEMIAILNELTRLSQAQQAEIEQLRAEIQTLKEGNN